MHIKEDLEYWGIDENLMTACCALSHFPELSHSQNESARDKENRLLDAQRAIEEDFGHAWYGKIRSFPLQIVSLRYGQMAIHQWYAG